MVSAAGPTKIGCSLSLIALCSVEKLTSQIKHQCRLTWSRRSHNCCLAYVLVENLTMFCPARSSRLPCSSPLNVTPARGMCLSLSSIRRMLERDAFRTPANHPLDFLFG